MNFNADYIARLGRKWASPEKAGRPEYIEQIAANVAAVPFRIETLGDLAYEAAAGTSHSPDVRQLMTEREYTAEIAEFCREIIGEKNDADAAAELERFYKGFREKKIAQLSASSRCVSVLVAGGSNFPVRRAEKANSAENRRIEELLEWLPRAKTAVRRNLGLLPDNGIISSDDPDAVGKIKEKIAKIQKDNEVGKAVNKVLRSKSLSDEEKEKQIAELKSDFTPFHTWYDSIGIPAYRLSLNNAEIKRLQGRLIQLERQAAAAAKQASNGGAPEWGFNGGRIVDNAADNRIQIFFDGKPDYEKRSELKKSGFRWAPSIGAWQAYRNTRALDRARAICGE